MQLRASTAGRPAGRRVPGYARRSAGLSLGAGRSPRLAAPWSRRWRTEPADGVASLGCAVAVSGGAEMETGRKRRVQRFATVDCASHVDQTPKNSVDEAQETTS
jgi:hypothetical protein